MEKSNLWKFNGKKKEGKWDLPTIGKETTTASAPVAACKLLATFLPFEIPFGATNLESSDFEEKYKKVKFSEKTKEK